MSRAATATFLVLLLLLVGINWSRLTRDTGEPALSREPAGIWVQLGEGFPEPGIVRQLNDDCRIVDVMNLTGARYTEKIISSVPIDTNIITGQRLDLIIQDTEILSFYVSWMSAAQRVTLGVRLHPDQMSQRDWEYLPGVGAGLAARIEENRQKNGDFGSFEALRRVKGVGVNKIAAWRRLF